MQALRSKTVPVNVADQSLLFLLHELCAVSTICRPICKISSRKYRYTNNQKTDP